MGLMNVIGFQFWNFVILVIFQGIQILVFQLQNVEIQIEREVLELGIVVLGFGEGEGLEYGVSGEDVFSRIQRLMVEGGMIVVVQWEQSIIMVFMGGFGNNIIVSYCIYCSFQMGIEFGVVYIFLFQFFIFWGLFLEVG